MTNINENSGWLAKIFSKLDINGDGKLNKSDDKLKNGFIKFFEIEDNMNADTFVHKNLYKTEDDLNAFNKGITRIYAANGLSEAWVEDGVKFTKYQSNPDETGDVIGGISKEVVNNDKQIVTEQYDLDMNYTGKETLINNDDGTVTRINENENGEITSKEENLSSDAFVSSFDFLTNVTKESNYPVGHFEENMDYLGGGYTQEITRDENGKTIYRTYKYGELVGESEDYQKVIRPADTFEINVHDDFAREEIYRQIMEQGAFDEVNITDQGIIQAKNTAEFEGEE